MTENKRFWIFNTLTVYSGIKDKDKLLTFNEVVDLLNELNDENKKLKQDLKELSDENEKLKFTITQLSIDFMDFKIRLLE